MSIKPSDFLYALRNETIRVIEELKPVLDKANSLYEHLDRIAEDCEDAAELVAANPPSSYTSATEEVHEDLNYQWGGNEQGSQSQLETLKRWHDSEMRKAQEQAWDEGITASGINLDWQLHLLDHNPYREES